MKTRPAHPGPTGGAPTRIGIIGDVHAQEGHLAAALAWMREAGAELLLCTGDLADGPGSVDRCCELLAESGALTVRGNHDRWLLEDRVREIPDAHRLGDLGRDARTFLEALPKTRQVETPAGPLLLCHGIGDNDLRKVWPGTERMEAERSPELDAILGEGQVKLLINGHMHYRVLIDFPELLLINAGTLAQRHRPGVSLLDFERGTITACEFVEGAVGPPVASHRLDPNGRRIWRDTEAFDGTWQAVTLYGETPA